MSSSIYTRMSKDNYFRMGYLYQMEGDLHSAAKCYIQSIENGPTAEAHTFLGWCLSMMGELDHAIEECKKAIQLNPQFGNAWNDIGAYLTEKNRYEEAIPYLKKACRLKGYDHREYAFYNLGRIYIQKEMLLSATKELQKAVKINPRFHPATRLLQNLEVQIH
ncbi:MAG: tetratricopeptide repeat protein [Bdellovibrionota bacterium]